MKELEKFSSINKDTGQKGKSNLLTTQSAITCSKLRIETLEQGVTYVQS